MAFWNSSTQIVDIFAGVKPNDGTGDNIRDSFLKVDNNFSNISSQLGQVNQDFLNANVEFNLQAQFGNITNLFVANATGAAANFTGNITSGNLIASTGLYSVGPAYINGNLNVYSSLIPQNNSVDLGSPTNRFRTVYSLSTDAATQIQSSSDSGILKVHANAFVGDIQDTGILGNISSDYNGRPEYCFFGHQYTTNNFIYKITDNDATVGNNIVVGGVYGNMQVGSGLFSNTTTSTSTTTGALIVAGGAGVAGNVYAGGDVRSAGNVYSYGYQVLTAGTPGYGNIFNGTGSTFLGTTIFPAAVPSVSFSTGAIAVPNGGIGVYGNVVAGGFSGPLYGAQNSISSLTVGGNVTIVNGQMNVRNVSATSLNSQDITVTGTASFLGVALTGLANVSTTTLYASGNTNVNNINSIGNVSAGYYLGNGSFLTGIPTAGQLQVLSANVGAYETWANATVQTLSANVGAFSITTNANIGGQQLAIASINANVGAYQIYANANVGAMSNSLQTLQANVGAYQIATNANLGTATNNIQTLSANVGAYETWANIQLTGGSTQALSANLGAYQIATNANIGSHQLSITSLATNANANTAAYLAASTITIGGTLTVPSIAHSGTSGTGDIGASGAAFGTVWATATSAKYADLAENYTSDASYEAGTVVVFGGEQEITTTNIFADVSVAGAISTNPAYLMNNETSGLPVALRGRIPVKVLGPVHKGDLLVTAGQNPGYATSIGRSTEHPLAVFAKSLETNTAEGIKIIEAVII
jgi:hypothetical protein